MKCLVLFSGGKDSTLALFLSMQSCFEPFLFSVVAEEYSMMYHYPNIELTKKQAEAMGLEIFYAKEGNEIEKIKELKESIGIEAMVCGAVKSDYQKTRIERMCYENGLKFYAPLWNLDPLRIYNALFEACFRFIITSVSANGLDESWLGKEITRNNLKELMDLCSKYGINPVFEGGEAETFVFDGPIFKHGLKIEEGKKEWKIMSGMYIIEKIRSVKKV